MRRTETNTSLNIAVDVALSRGAPRDKGHGAVGQALFGGFRYILL
jgi:hypothetical protein